MKKLCKGCNTAKPVNNFSKHCKSKDGLQSRCKDCNKQYRLENKDKISKAKKKCYLDKIDTYKKVNKKHYLDNRKYRLKKAKEWREANPDRKKENDKNWKRKNHGAVIASVVARKKKIRKATSSWANHTKIKEFYIQSCKLQEETGTKHHVDHIIPINGNKVSGLHVETNLQIIPASKNLSKSNKFKIDT